MHDAERAFCIRNVFRSLRNLPRGGGGIVQEGVLLLGVCIPYRTLSCIVCRYSLAARSWRDGSLCAACVDAYVILAFAESIHSLDI